MHCCLLVRRSWWVWGAPCHPSVEGRERGVEEQRGSRVPFGAQLSVVWFHVVKV